MTFLSIYNSVKSFQQNLWKNWFRGTKFYFNFFYHFILLTTKIYHSLPLLQQILWRDFRQTHSFYRLDCFSATQKILHNNGTVQFIKRGATTLNTMTFSITTLSITKLYHYAECNILFDVMLSVIILNVVMLSVVMLSVVTPKNSQYSPIFHRIGSWFQVNEYIWYQGPVLQNVLQMFVCPWQSFTA